MRQAEGELVGELVPRHEAQIRLPGVVEATPTALVLDPQITEEEWLNVGEKLALIKSANQWWIADWWRHSEPYGERVDEARRKGHNPATCRKVAIVGNAFDNVLRRRSTLSFEHHYEVRVDEENEQDAWLNLCEEHEWSRARLRQERQTERTAMALAEQAGPEQAPTISLAHYADWLERQPEADLILTDPPYATDVDNIREFAADWLPLALKQMKSTGRAYICVGAYPGELDAYMSVAMPDQILVWTYRNTLGPSPSHDYKLNWQAILYYKGSEAPPLNCASMLEQFSVQDIPAPDGRLGDRVHRWQKPLELGERLVRHATEAGAVVLDPFSGSGTFLVAAGGLGRIAHGCDIDQEAIDLAVKRGCRRGNS